MRNEDSRGIAGAIIAAHTKPGISGTRRGFTIDDGVHPPIHCVQEPRSGRYRVYDRAGHVYMTYAKQGRLMRCTGSVN